MCCLIVCPSSTRPALDDLRRIARANPHGLGMAWEGDGAIQWMKTDDVEELHAHSLRLWRTVVIHARWASVGGVNPLLRHPFPITREAELSDRGSAPAVLFHNGTWRDWDAALGLAGEPAPSGPMSDSRAAAWLSAVRGDTRWLRKVWSRWVVFRAGRQPRMVGEFHLYRGCHFSNLAWLREDAPRGTGLVSRPSPRPKSQMSSSGKPARELPDRMPAKPWFTLSEEFRSTAARRRAA